MAVEVGFTIRTFAGSIAKIVTSIQLSSCRKQGFQGNDVCVNENAKKRKNKALLVLYEIFLHFFHLPCKSETTNYQFQVL